MQDPHLITCSPLGKAPHAMDDDAPVSTQSYQRRKPHAEPPQKKRTGTQGKYLLPKEGVIWIWKRNGDFFVGLDVRDTAATQSIVNSQFEGHVKAASKSKGRRSNTRIPQEDLQLLKT